MGKHIIKTIFLSGKISSTLIIPKEIARKYGLDEPSNVILEESENGILIKKLEV
ncbi:MAG: AbrB/MazE/SpoVT family DNA-binding domain-containing protein [Candidatus Nitrosocosmicus sp.]|nr:AbrB/MazE/SpoVT family DNA-binding domain-containing protein [Candidatus Nitrosocosmicus sp.]